MLDNNRQHERIRRSQCWGVEVYQHKCSGTHILQVCTRGIQLSQSSVVLQIRETYGGCRICGRNDEGIVFHPLAYESDRWGVVVYA